MSGFVIGIGIEFVVHILSVQQTILHSTLSTFGQIVLHFLSLLSVNAVTPRPTKVQGRWPPPPSVDSSAPAKPIPPPKKPIIPPR